MYSVSFSFVQPSLPKPAELTPTQFITFLFVQPAVTQTITLFKLTKISRTSTSTVYNISLCTARRCTNHNLYKPPQRRHWMQRHRCYSPACFIPRICNSLSVKPMLLSISLFPRSDSIELIPIPPIISLISWFQAVRRLTSLL